MKLLTCNGCVLEIRDAGPVIFRLTAGAVPLKAHGVRLLEDDAARAELRALLETGLYAGGKIEPPTS